MMIMFKDIEVGSQPNTMTVIAQAVWNPLGYWEVTVTQTETSTVLPKKEFSLSQRTQQVKVRDCDEFVIADALLHANGIDIKNLYEIAENPILE
jgi:hypothetical protein